MTGMEESSCRSAPVTGERMPGMASPTAIASTLNAKAACSSAARTAHTPGELRIRMIRESFSWRPASLMHWERCAWRFEAVEGGQILRNYAILGEQHSVV